jgi:Protein of unknown function (DUF3618)
VTSKETSEIEHDLHRTRERLNHNLDELQARLSPGQMVDEALSYLRHGEAADFGRNLVSSVKTNPLPVALIGVGIAWLMTGGGEPRYARASWETVEDDDWYEDDLSERSRLAGEAVVRTSTESDEAYRLRVLEARGHVLGVSRSTDENTEAYSHRVERAASDALSRMRESAARARDKVASWGSSMSRRMSSGASATRRGVGSRAAAAYGSASSGASAVYEGVSSGASSIYEGVSSGASSVYGGVSSGASALYEGAGASGETLRRAGQSVVQSFREQPLLLGALGLTVGAVLAALLPRSREEERFFGEVRERTADELRAAGQEIAGRAQRVASRMAEAGKEAAAEETRDFTDHTTGQSSGREHEERRSETGMSGTSMAGAGTAGSSGLSGGTGRAGGMTGVPGSAGPAAGSSGTTTGTPHTGSPQRTI